MGTSTLGVFDPAPPAFSSSYPARRDFATFFSVAGQPPYARGRSLHLSQLHAPLCWQTTARGSARTPNPQQHRSRPTLPPWPSPALHELSTPTTASASRRVPPPRPGPTRPPRTAGITPAVLRPETPPPLRRGKRGQRGKRGPVDFRSLKSTGPLCAPSMEVASKVSWGQSWRSARVFICPQEVV